jgi:hypothetical protein
MERSLPEGYATLDEYLWHLDQSQLFDLDGPIEKEPSSLLRVECVYIDSETKTVTQHSSHLLDLSAYPSSKGMCTIPSHEWRRFAESMQLSESMRLSEARLFFLPLYFPHLNAFLRTSSTQIALEYTKPVDWNQDILLPPSLPIFHTSHARYFLYRTKIKPKPKLAASSTSRLPLWKTPVAKTQRKKVKFQD